MTVNTLNVVGPTTFWQVGVYQLGIAVVTESLRWAAVGLLQESTTPRQAKRVEEAVVFIEGTGLDVWIDAFRLGLRADHVRDQFHAWLKQRTTPYYP